MAHHKSTLKRIITNNKRNLHNRIEKSRLRKAIKAVRLAENKEEGMKALQTASSYLDKAKKRKVIPKGRADRLKSRLSKLVNKMQS